MNPFEKGPDAITPLTDAEKAKVRERLLAQKNHVSKLETKEEKEKRRTEFAAKMAGKGLTEMGEQVVHEKYVPGNKEQAA